jgi:DNA-binding transcriptional ArsR family regulator
MTPQKLDSVFQALGDRTRRAILARLAKGEASVNELAQPFDMSQPSISRHLKVLEAAGLIELGERSAQFRPRRLKAEALAEARAWMDQVGAMWTDSFDRLDEFIANTTADRAKARGKSKPKAKPHGKRT